MLFMLAAVVPPAIAQEPGATRGHRVGPFLVIPTVTLQDVGVDANVYHSATDPVSDFTFTLRPMADVSGRVLRSAVTLRTATELVYFARETTERSVNQDLAATVRVPLRRLTLMTGGMYLNTRERPNEEIDARSRRIDWSGDGGFSLAVTPKLAAVVMGRSATTRFDADAIFDGISLPHQLNRRVRTVSGSLRFGVTRLVTLVTGVDESRAKFVEASERDSRSRQGSIGVELHPRALIAGKASLGYQQYRSRNPLVPRYNGLIGSASVTYRVSSLTELGVSYDRVLEHSYSPVEPYYLRNGFGLSVRRQLMGRWDLEVGGSRFHHNYRGAPLDVISTGDDRLLDAMVAVGYTARPGTRLLVAAGYGDRLSRVDARSYDNLRVMTTFSYGF